MRPVPYREEWIIAARYWCVVAAVKRHQTDRPAAVEALHQAQRCFRSATVALPRATAAAAFGPILRPLDGPIQ